MKSFEGYLKQTAGDTYLLLAGGGIKPISEIWHSGNFTPGNYLPLTGGTLHNNTSTSGSSYILEVINDNTNNWCRSIGCFSPNLTVGNHIQFNLGTSSTQYNELALAFYNAGDQSTDNYVSLGLHSAGDLLVVKANGNIGIGTTSPTARLHIVQGSSNGTPNGTYITDSSNAWAMRSFEILAPNLTSGSSPFIVVGKIDSTRNMAWMGYVHSSDGSTANRLSFGLHSVDNILNVVGNGYVGIRTVSPDHALTVYGEHSISAHYPFSYHPCYTDGAGRPGLSISGYYPYIWLTGGAASNVNHGATITLSALDGASATSGAFKGWTFGVPGYNATWMDLGYGSHNNPHYHGQAGYTSGWSGRVIRFTPETTNFFNNVYVNDGNVARGNEHIISPRGGSYSSNAYSETGYIIIRFPIALKYCMMSIWIDIFSYSTNHSCTIHCGAYTYDSSFGHAPFSRCIGRQLTTRFCYDSSYYYIVVGESNTEWYYPKFMVRDMLVGYNHSVSSWLGQSLYCYISTSLPGTVYSSMNGFVATTDQLSDIRKKKNIKRISNLLPLYEFQMIDDDRKLYGVIAQDLEKMGLFELVNDNADLKYVYYIPTLSLLLAKLSNIVEENNNSINSRINMLEKRILDLELENQDLKERLNN